MADHLTDVNIINPPASTSTPGFDRNTTMITPAQIKSDYLWGVKLTNKDGVEIPDSVVERHLLSAISTFEVGTNIVVTPTQFVDQKDFRIEDYSSWSILHLDRMPIISVESIEIQFIRDHPQTIAFPEEWYRIYPLAGQIQLTPTGGSMAGWAISAGGLMLPSTGLLFRKDFPSLFKISYTAGFENDKIPYLVVDTIAKMASLTILALLANVIIAPGIAGYSLGLDGVSQAVTKLPSPYMDLMQMYSQQIQDQLSKIKKYFQRINLVVC